MVCSACHSFSPRPGSSVELSPVGYHFLTDLFHKYDLDGDQALSPAEQEVGQDVLSRATV